LTDVAARLSDIEKKATLQSQADAAEQEILDALRRPSLEEAESILDNADRAGLDAELVELKGRFADQDQRTRDLFSAHSKAVDQVEAVGGDAAVAMIEEQRRTVLLEIEEGAIRYLRLRVGIVAAEVPGGVAGAAAPFQAAEIPAGQFGDGADDGHDGVLL
jgi:uncharacterized protein YhaN